LLDFEENVIKNSNIFGYEKEFVIKADIFWFLKKIKNKN